MRRREFLGVVGGAAAAWPLAARAQSTETIRKVGILWPGASAPVSPRLESFAKGCMRRASLKAIELRYAQNGLQQLPELAAELVRLKVEAIQASGDFAPRVAQQATSTISILAFTDDVLGAGLVASLSRPGSNITGLTILAPELSAKRLEALSEIVPSLSRVTVFWDPASNRSQVTTTETAARAMNIGVQVVEVRSRGDLSGAFAAARTDGSQAINVLNSPILASFSREIIMLAAEYRLPAIYQWKEQVEAGGLVSYGPSLVQLWRQAGVLIGKLLKGAKPADMPVEQPTKFRIGGERHNCKDAGPDAITVNFGACRRGDRIAAVCCGANGREWHIAVAIGLGADIGWALALDQPVANDPSATLELRCSTASEATSRSAVRAVTMPLTFP